MREKNQQKKSFNESFYKVISERQHRIFQDGIRPINVSSNIFKDNDLSKTIKQSEYILEKLRYFR